MKKRLLVLAHREEPLLQAEQKFRLADVWKIFLLSTADPPDFI
jgi:hypothetical protein